jgi:hypothetical protein
MNFNFFQEPKWIIKDLPIPPVDIGKYTAEVAQEIGLEPSMGAQPYEVFKRALEKILKEKEKTAKSKRDRLFRACPVYFVPTCRI